MTQQDNQQPDCFSNSEGSLTVEQALQRVKSLLPVIDETETLSLDHCLGRIAGNAVVCEQAQPSFANSSMDGYAFNSAALTSVSAAPLKLLEAGVSLAGHPFTGNVTLNQCVRITTGAKMPADCDTVVIKENITVIESGGETRIEINHLPAPGDNVRAIGSNLARGDVLCERGSKIHPALLGLIASTGMVGIRSIRPLKVAVFSTGDELVVPGATAGDGQIYDANGYLLKSLLQSPCIEVTDLGIVADSSDAVREVMREASQADIALSSGGVSVGEADVVKQVLDEIGTLQMWKILMKPGRPLTFGTLDSGTRYFGLPGNPVSAMVTFAIFVVPAIRHMLGMPQQPTDILKAICCDDLAKQPGRMELQRGILTLRDDGRWQVATTGLQDSHILASMAKANCFIRLSIESSGAASGELVDVIPLQNFTI